MKIHCDVSVWDISEDIQIYTIKVQNGASIDCFLKYLVSVTAHGPLEPRLSDHQMSADHLITNWYFYHLIILPPDIFTTPYFTTSFFYHQISADHLITNWFFYHLIFHHLIFLPPYNFTTWYFYHFIFYHLIFLPPYTDFCSIFAWFYSFTCAWLYIWFANHFILKVSPYNKFYLLFAHPVFYDFYLLYVFRS